MDSFRLFTRLKEANISNIRFFHSAMGLFELLRTNGLLWYAEYSFDILVKCLQISTQSTLSSPTRVNCRRSFLYSISNFHYESNFFVLSLISTHVLFIKKSLFHKRSELACRPPLASHFFVSPWRYRKQFVYLPPDVFPWNANRWTVAEACRLNPWNVVCFHKPGHLARFIPRSVGWTRAGFSAYFRFSFPTLFWILFISGSSIKMTCVPLYAIHFVLHFHWSWDFGWIVSLTFTSVVQFWVKLSFFFVTCYVIPIALPPSNPLLSKFTDKFPCPL